MENSRVRWCGDDDRRPIPQPALTGGSSSIDHTLLRDTDTDANGVPDDRISWIIGSAYDIRGDLDLNGIVNIDDLTAAIANAGTITGWKDLTSDDVGNLKDYAGYEFDSTIQRHWTTWHIRHRVLTSNLGRWMQRDPIWPSDDENAYRYSRSRPLAASDPYGLFEVPFASMLGPQRSLPIPGDPDGQPLPMHPGPWWNPPNLNPTPLPHPPDCNQTSCSGSATSCEVSWESEVFSPGCLSNSMKECARDALHANYCQVLPPTFDTCTTPSCSCLCREPVVADLWDESPRPDANATCATDTNCKIHAFGITERTLYWSWTGDCKANVSDDEALQCLLPYYEPTGGP
jgi:RHS repeat-associated protein